MRRVPGKHDMTLKRRMNVIFLFFCLLFGLLLTRLFMLQISAHAQYATLAANQHRLVQELYPHRGGISMVDKDGDRHVLAGNHILRHVAASPRQILERDGYAWSLSSALGISEDGIREKLSNGGSTYALITKAVSEEAAKRVRDLALEGIYLEEEERRHYPRADFASHIIGFASKIDRREEGRYGLERMYNTQLSGSGGFFEGVKDSDGYLVALGKRILHPPKNGSDLLLTIDPNIQLKAERILDEVRTKWRASSGLALVMDPKTGKIIASAARPSFDPEEYPEEQDLSVFLNPLVQKQYELGSVLKPITMAAAVEEGVVTPDTVYTDSGTARFGGSVIKNFDGNAYGVQTMTQVIEKSLNTGMVFVSRKLGKERHLNALERFGLGQKSGIDLPGEIAGDISNLSHGREIDFATASFGQGIAVTPIQLAAAMGAIANGGELLTPYVVENVADDAGNETKRGPMVKRRVISPETSEAITKMLVSAVRNGFENRAGVDGYFVAGKTGTAQMPRSDERGYDEDRVIHTFVGYAPAFDPKFLILLQLNEPTGNRFAANTLTPAFHDLAEYILNYYEVPPDER